VFNWLKGDVHFSSVEESPYQELPSLCKTNKQGGKNYMKKLLLIALVASGLAFVPVQRSDAQVSVGIGPVGVGVGFGYPAYYGYYPYGYYYRPYPYYGYYYGPSYYWYGVLPPSPSSLPWVLGDAGTENSLNWLGTNSKPVLF